MSINTIKDLKLLNDKIKKQFSNYRNISIGDIDKYMEKLTTFKVELQKIKNQRKYLSKNKPILYKENKEIIKKNITKINTILKSLNVYFKNKKSRIEHFESYLKIVKDLLTDEEFKSKVKNARLEFDKELPKEIQHFKKSSYLNYKHYRAMGYSVTKIKKEDEKLQKLLKEV